jgi:hypothetical protein
MTNDQINAAITEATGLWDHPYSSDTRVMMDFCRDLNAMHEAEKELTVEQWHDYVDFMPSRWECAVHATARQRAEAFLRTLGKWEEGK